MQPSLWMWVRVCGALTSRTTIARQMGMEMHAETKERGIERATCKKFYCLQAFAPFSKHKMLWMPYNTSHSKDMCALYLSCIAICIYVKSTFLFASSPSVSWAPPSPFAFMISHFHNFFCIGHVQPLHNAHTLSVFVRLSYKWKW